MPKILRYRKDSGEVREFDVSISACKRFSFLYGQRVRTPDGSATVVGVRKERLWFHVDGADGASCFKEGGHIVLLDNTRTSLKRAASPPRIRQTARKSSSEENRMRDMPVLSTTRSSSFGRTSTAIGGAPAAKKQRVDELKREPLRVTPVELAAAFEEAIGPARSGAYLERAGPFPLVVFRSYARYMALRAVAGDVDAQELSPSYTVDRIWHEHILDTPNYQNDCIKAFNRVLHHRPEGASDFERGARAARYRATLKAMAKEFGKDSIQDREWNPANMPPDITSVRAPSADSTANFVFPSFVTSTSPPASDFFVVKGGGLRLAFALTSDITGAVLANTISQTFGIKLDQLRLIFDSERMGLFETLVSHGVTSGDVIYVSLEQRGC